MAFHMTTNQTLTSSRQACLIGVTPNNVENRTAQVRESVFGSATNPMLLTEGLVVRRQL